MTSTKDCPQFDGPSRSKVGVPGRDRVKPCEVGREIQRGCCIGHLTAGALISGPGLGIARCAGKSRCVSRKPAGGGRGTPTVGNSIISCPVDVEDVDRFGGCAPAGIQKGSSRETCDTGYQEAPTLTWG